MDQLTQFNEGGTHEENPLGGVPQGMGPQGPNLVEEGETKLNVENYIFSDRLKVDREIAGLYNLPNKYIGKTFADVSKKMDFSDSRRDGDEIETAQSKRDLNMLMEAQEKFKELDLERDLTMMKEKHPEFMQFMEESMSQAGEQGQQMPQEAVQDPNMMQIPPQEGAPQAIDPNMMQEQEAPQLPIPGMRYGGDMYARGGELDNTSKKGEPEKPKSKYEGHNWKKTDPVERPITQDYQRTPEYKNASATTRNALDYEHNNVMMFDVQTDTWHPMDAAQVESDGANTRFPGYDNFTQSVSDGTWKHPTSTFTHYGADGSSRVAKYPSEVLDTQFYSSPEAIQKASGGYLDGRFEDEALETTQNEQQIQSSNDQLANMTSNIPIVGAAIGAGNAIGKPIKTGLEKTEEDGTFKNKKNAQTGYAAAAFLSPSKILIDSFSDKNATAGEKALSIGNVFLPGLAGIGAQKYANRKENANKVVNYQDSEETNKLDQQAASETYYAGGGYMGMSPGPGDPPTKTLSGGNAATLTPEERARVEEAWKKQNPRLNKTAPEGWYQTPEQYERFKADGTFGWEYPSEIIKVPEESTVSTPTQGARKQAHMIMRTPGGKAEWVSPNEYLEYSGSKNILDVDSEGFPIQGGTNGARYKNYDDKRTFANGGYTENMYLRGGTTKLNNGELTPEQLEEEAYLNRTVDVVGEDDYLNRSVANLQNQRTEAGMTNSETVPQYDDSRNQFSQGENTDANVDLRFKQTIPNAIGTYAPAAYNIGMGLFGKTDKKKLEDYYREVEAYRMNIDPQLRETEQTFAAGQNAIRNAGTGASYLASMKQMADSRNKSFASLHNQKEQFDIAQKYNTDVLNNKNRSDTQMWVDDYNNKSKAAKQNYLQEGIKQVGDISQSNTQNKLATQYNQLYAPDFAGKTGQLTISERIMENYRARQAAKKNNI